MWKVEIGSKKMESGNWEEGVQSQILKKIDTNIFS